MKCTEESRNIKSSLRINFSSNHGGIWKYIDVKKSQKYIYTIMEYCNGEILDENLKKYKIKCGIAFSERIIQYIIRKIFDVIS